MQQVKVDGKKLRRILELKNLTISEVSTACGFASTYISNVTARNQASKPFIDNLERLYGICYDDFKPAEAEEHAEKIEEKPETDQITLSQESIDKIQRAIRNGIFYAIKDLHSEGII